MRLQRERFVAEFLVKAHVLETVSLKQAVSSIVKLKLGWEFRISIYPDQALPRSRQSADGLLAFGCELEFIGGPTVECFCTHEAERNAWICSIALRAFDNFSKTYFSDWMAGIGKCERVGWIKVQFSCQRAQHAALARDDFAVV